MRKQYKEPVFLFTSCSLRFAAWAGWYSALGEKDLAEKWVHQAHTEWAKEIGGGRKYAFLDRFNHDMWSYIPNQAMKKLIDTFLKSIKSEIKKGKEKAGK